jgi:hypothetical protein
VSNEISRDWTRGSLGCLGLAFIGVGLPFFVLVYSVGAPKVPFLGLVVAALGAWLLVLPWLRGRR